MRSGFYVLKGEPHGYISYKDRHASEWSPIKGAFSIAKVTFEGQHEGQPLYSGPLEVYINFYFKYPIHKKKRSLVGPFHSTSVSLFCLYRFIEEASRGILIEKFSTIVDLHLFKIYADEPRTEIIIKERKT